MKAPRVPNPVLSHPTLEQVKQLIRAAPGLRNKAIVALFADTGLRVSELAAIDPRRIDWEGNIILIDTKGRKQRRVKFGHTTRTLLQDYLASGPPKEQGLFGLTASSIQVMLRRLEHETGIKCNPHSFRRFFATELRRRGSDTQTIQYLGGWESIEMVARYSRAVQEEVALAEYVPLTDD